MDSVAALSAPRSSPLRCSLGTPRGVTWSWGRIRSSLTAPATVVHHDTRHTSAWAPVLTPPPGTVPTPTRGVTSLRGINGCAPSRGYRVGVEYAELEEAICQVPSVSAARVVGRRGAIEEVHVISTAAKPPKQVVRDVQSLALAGYGVSIDRRVISVVQVAEGVRVGGDRIEIVDVTEQVDGSRAEVSVALGWSHRQAVGTASGSAAQAVRARLIGEAALAAIMDVIEAEHTMALAALEVPSVGGRHVAVAQVVLVTGGTERMLTGCALVGEDSRVACVRAVLDALNRTIPTLQR